MAENLLYYGDNLDILRRYVKDETVDLVYLDPPFNSDQNYNVLFAEHNGSRSSAQIHAFEDTWRWDQAAAEAYDEITTSTQVPQRVSMALQSFRNFLGDSDMTAYLCMMAPRLLELHRVLKPTGSIYLHCDPTASHYLKMLMDSIFAPQNFRTEIIWKRSSAHSDTKQGRKQHGRIHNVILFYTVGPEWKWNPVYSAYDREYTSAEYRHVSSDSRRYKETDCTAAKPGGDTEFIWRVKRRTGSGERWQADTDDEFKTPLATFEYKGVRPYSGRYWAYSRRNLIEFWKADRLVHRSTGMPRLIQFVDEMPGISSQDLWIDIPPELGKANLGYPTQKPQALLERIISASSREGDVVLDPFCGCGTAVIAAERLKRKWIGIDITHLAITLIKHRLRDSFGEAVQYKVVGEPVSLPDAETLAAEDPYQFQWWALGLDGARPAEQKKGADKGIDGRRFFNDEAGGKTKQIIYSVKAGHLTPAHIRDLRGVLDRENAAIGVLICMEEPTQQMRAEAASAGFYDSPGWHKKYPKLQILSIAELLQGKRVECPPSRYADTTFKKAPRQKTKRRKSGRLGDAVREKADAGEW